MISVIRSGLDASLKHIDVVSNNIANARTTGFKSSATFQDVYEKTAFKSRKNRAGISCGTIAATRRKAP